MRNAEVKSSSERMSKHIDAVMKMSETEVNEKLKEQIPALKGVDNIELNERRGMLLKSYLADIFWTPTPTT